MKCRMPDIRSIKKSLDRYGKPIRTAVAIMILLAAVFLFGAKGENDQDIITSITTEHDGNNQSQICDTTMEDITPKEPSLLICDISGEVNNPGVYTVEEEARLKDLIDLAGGITENADINAINRAAELKDGIKVYIPGIDENVGVANQFNGISPPDKSLYEDSGTSSNKISINTGSLEELQKIPGVGPVTAQKIIDYRESSGGFSNIEELMNISGIGEKTYKKMADYVIL